MSTLYLLYGVPGSGKEKLIESMSESHFVMGLKNIVEEETYEKEEEIVKYILEGGEDALLDIHNAMNSVFQYWFETMHGLGHKVKVIVMSTPLDIIMENTDLDEDHMQQLYNNFVNTIGWLYLNYPATVINSEHL